MKWFLELEGMRDNMPYKIKSYIFQPSVQI